MAAHTPDMLITRHVYKLQIVNNYTLVFTVIETKWATVDNLPCTISLLIHSWLWANFPYLCIEAK